MHSQPVGGTLPSTHLYAQQADKHRCLFTLFVATILVLLAVTAPFFIPRNTTLPIIGIALGIFVLKVIVEVCKKPKATLLVKSAHQSVVPTTPKGQARAWLHENGFKHSNDAIWYKHVTADERFIFPPGIKQHNTASSPTESGLHVLTVYVEALQEEVPSVPVLLVGRP